LILKNYSVKVQFVTNCFIMSIQHIDEINIEPKQTNVQPTVVTIQIDDIYNDENENNSIKSICILLCGLSCFIIFMFILINMTFFGY
jgi:hypothetical protein